MLLSTGRPISGAYRVEVLDRIADVPREAWNAVVARAGGGVFHTHEWLTAFESAPPGEFRAAHVLAYAGDELVGACPAYLTLDCPRLNYLRALGTPRDLPLDRPMLLAHSLAALEGGPLAPDPAVGTALAEGLERAAADLGAAAAGYVNLPAGGFAGQLLSAGYASATIATGYVLPIRWTDPQQYWKSLYRRRRRRLLRERNLQLAGSTIHRGLSGVDGTAELVRGLLVARGTPTQLLPAPFVDALVERLRPYDRSVVARDATGRPTGLFATWAVGGRWAAWLAGLDPAGTTVFEPYHALLAELVEYAIEAGATSLDLGRANGTVKRRYGAHAQPLLLSVKAARRSDQATLHLWCRSLEDHHRAALHGLETDSRCC
jgi:hypothetical protein